MMHKILTRFAALWVALGGRHRMITRRRGGVGADYLHRFFLTPALLSRWFAVYLHCFHADDDEGLHDHPWPFVTVPLTLTGYCEVDWQGWTHVRGPWPRFRSSRAFHRIELFPGTAGRTWTLFFRGPVIKPWGFVSREAELSYRVHPPEPRETALGLG